jgi:hypothetical protein
MTVAIPVPAASLAILPLHVPRYEPGESGPVGLLSRSEHDVTVSATIAAMNNDDAVWTMATNE